MLWRLRLIVFELVPKSRISEMASRRKKEHISKILQLLQENRAGLTSVQIAILTGTRSPRGLLLELQNQGIIKQRKGIASDGRVALLYVLTKGEKVKKE